MVRSLRAAAAVAIVLLPSAARAEGGDPAAAVPPASPDLSEVALPVEKVVLPNGLTVMLAPDSRARLVSVCVEYHAGMADEPDGLRGLAHAVEHQVAPHTKHIPDVFRELEAAGASDFGAQTNTDGTVYFETVPPERLASALWIESDRMGYAAGAVTEERTRAQAATIANELRDRGPDRGLSSLPPVLSDELYPGGHPYAWNDDPSDPKSIRADDVLAFLRTWYMPANATLAIAGAFDRDTALALVTHDFAGLPSNRPPARPPVPDRPEEAVFLLMHAGILHDEMILGWRTPALGTADDAALDVVATILGGMNDLGLPKRLIDTHRALGVHVEQESQRRGSVFSVVLTLPQAATALDDLLADTQKAIDDLARSDDPRLVAALAQAHGRERAQTLEALERPRQRAVRLARVLSEDPGPFDWDVARHDAVKAADVARLATTYLGAWRRVLATIFADRVFPYAGLVIRRDRQRR